MPTTTATFVILVMLVLVASLQTQDRGGNLTVADRLIPLEPLYIVMNLAMSNGAWARVADDLEYPGVMSIDHVRIWQRPSAISVGCDAANFTTSQYISCNRHLYLADNERGMWKFPYCRDINAGVRGGSAAGLAAYSLLRQGANPRHVHCFGAQTNV